MASTPHLRRTVSELFVLYRVEPSLRHVFSEGKMDRAVLAHFVRSAGLQADVYRVDDYVDLSELLSEHQDHTGVRARLILLAEAFAKEFSDGSRPHSLTCVIDRDSGVQSQTESLLLTDYADMELYSWTNVRVSKILGLGFGLDATADTVTELMSFVEERAVPLCICRRVVHNMGRGMVPPSNVAKYACPREGVMDLFGFIRAYGGAVARESLAIASEVEQRTAVALLEDVRLHMNGHDVVTITSAAIRGRLGRTMNVAELERAWFTCLEWEDLLDSEPMFQALRHRLSA